MNILSDAGPRLLCCSFCQTKGLDYDHGGLLSVEWLEREPQSRCWRVTAMSAIDRVLLQPFQQQYVTDSQKHRSDKESDKSVDNHAAYDTNQNDRHGHFHPST
jgi:hypothetical protein